MRSSDENDPHGQHNAESNSHPDEFEYFFAHRKALLSLS
jgi:hypothetical protein